MRRYRVHASRTQFIELSRLTYDVVQSSKIIAAGRVRPLVYVTPFFQYVFVTFCACTFALSMSLEATNTLN